METGATLQTAPENRETLLSFAEGHQAQGRLEESAAAFREFLEREPGNTKALMALGRIERRLGDDSAACDYLSAAATINPNDLQILTELAAVLRDLERPQESKSVYQDILTLDSAHVPSHMGLGWIARAGGNEEAALMHFTAAAEHLRKAAAVQPKSIHILTQLATALRELYRAQEAAPIYREILAVDAKHVYSHMGLGWIARGLGDHQAAFAHFKAAAEMNPRDAQAQICLARFLVHLHRNEEAETIFLRVIAQAPKHSQARAGLGALARARDDWAGAFEQFRIAVDSNPKSVQFRIDLADAFNELARWEEAEEIYRSILEESPLNIEALLGMAETAKARGDTARATALLKRAAAAAPLDLRPKQELRYLKSEQGSYDWRAEVEDALACVRAADAPPGMQLEAAKILVEYGLTEAAQPALSRLEARFPAARQLLLAVRQIDRMGLAQPLAAGPVDPDSPENQLDSMHGFVEMPVPDSDTLLIVFAGTNNRLWMTFSLLHKILRKTGVNIVYCRDLQRVWYARGIVGLGNDFESTVQGFESLVSRYGAKRLLMLGNCVGCLGALRFGLALGAQSVLCLGPKLRPAETMKFDQRARMRSVLEDLPSGHKNFHVQYLEALSRPNVTLIFGEQCAGDAADAHFMADVPGVTLTAIPDSSDPDSVKDLLVRGLLEPVLKSFMADGAVSAELHDLISASGASTSASRHAS